MNVLHVALTRLDAVPVGRLPRDCGEVRRAGLRRRLARLGRHREERPRHVRALLEILGQSTERRDKLERNQHFWRKGLREIGLVIKEGDSPIVPVMLFNAKLSQDIARDLFYEGIYVIGFFFPVVPAGQARIRTQMSADHEIPQLEQALLAFKKIGAKYGILGLDKKGIIEKYGM
jgi:hypothetical protein